MGFGAPDNTTFKHEHLLHAGFVFFGPEVGTILDKIVRGKHASDDKDLSESHYERSCL